MSRTPIPDYLIHDPAQTEADREKFDGLCRIFSLVAAPHVEAALEADAESRRSAHPFIRALCDGFNFDPWGYNDETVEEETDMAAQILASAWIDYLSALQEGNSDEIILNQCLLDQKQMRVGLEQFQLLSAAVSQTPLARNDAFLNVLKEAGGLIVNGNGYADLPLNMALKRGHSAANDAPQYHLTRG